MRSFFQLEIWVMRAESLSLSLSSSASVSSFSSASWSVSSNREKFALRFGGDHEPPRLLATQGLADPLLHLPRRLVGEGDRSYVAGVIAALLHQIGDLVGDDAGLARSGTRQHQARAGDKLDRFVLIGVELHGPDLLAYDEGRHCNRDPAGSRNRTQDPATSPCVCPSFSGSWPTFPEEMRGA